MNNLQISPVNFQSKNPSGIKKLVIMGEKRGQKLVCCYQGQPLEKLTALGYHVIETNKGNKRLIDSYVLTNKKGLDTETVAGMLERMQKYVGDQFNMVFEFYKHATKG